LVRAHEQNLAAQLITGLGRMPGIKTYGPRDASIQCGVVSFNIDGATPSEVGLILDQQFGIMARTGLHCAPSAHRTLGSYPTGTVRFSFGWLNTADEVAAALEALRNIAHCATSPTPHQARTWTA